MLDRLDGLEHVKDLSLFSYSSTVIYLMSGFGVGAIALLTLLLISAPYFWFIEVFRGFVEAFSIGVMLHSFSGCFG